MRPSEKSEEQWAQHAFLQFGSSLSNFFGFSKSMEDKEKWKNQAAACGPRSG